MKTLSHEEARRFYDRFGRKQDWQRFYEDRAVADVIENLSLADARSVFELGCGTGRLAAKLLADHLPPEARYAAVDVSSTMVALARERLARFGPRAEVSVTDGSMRLGAEPGSADRFVAVYVLDLLSEGDIRELLAEAHRILTPGGLVGLVSLTRGETAVARAVEWLWVKLHSLRPSLVGGCRPLSLPGFLDQERWRVRHRRIVTRFGISSEVVVAERCSP